MAIEIFIRRAGTTDDQDPNRAYEVLVGAGDPNAADGSPAKLTKRVIRDKRGDEVRTIIDGGTSETFYFKTSGAITKGTLRSMLDQKKTERPKLDAEGKPLENPDGTAQMEDVSYKTALTEWVRDHSAPPRTQEDITPKKEADAKIE